MADKINLIATRSMTYNTRRLVADDPFEARPRDARLLVAIGKARQVDEPAPALARAPKAVAPPPAQPKNSRKARAPKTEA